MPSSDESRGHQDAAVERLKRRRQLRRLAQRYAAQGIPVRKFLEELDRREARKGRGDQ